jgi:hypothetical protein
VIWRFIANQEMGDGQCVPRHWQLIRRANFLPTALDCNQLHLSFSVFGTGARPFNRTWQPWGLEILSSEEVDCSSDLHPVPRNFARENRKYDPVMSEAVV